jgi:hypothetical protein
VINIRISSEVELQLSGMAILDMSGRTVATYPWQRLEMGTLSAVEVDVSGLAAGIYLLQVASADGDIGVERFVVE